MYTHVAITDQEFEWDEFKRAQNVGKHGIDLLLGIYLFDGRPTISYPSPRNGEDRTVTIGWIEAFLLALILTERDDAIRLISLRRARDAERRAYEARIGR